MNKYAGMSWHWAAVLATVVRRAEEGCCDGAVMTSWLDGEVYEECYTLPWSMMIINTWLGLCLSTTCCVMVLLTMDSEKHIYYIHATSSSTFVQLSKMSTNKTPRSTSYIQRHPWYTLEHIVLCILVVHFLLQLRPSPTSSSPSPTIQPPSIHILESPDVHKAPPPTLDISTLQPGNSVHASDNRGHIHRFVLQAPLYVVNAYFTKAHAMRSGDLHNCTQYDVLLSGRASLTMRDVATGKDVVQVVEPQQLIAIPPRVPHLFEFLQDSYLIEWWDCVFEAWYYTPLRQRITT